MILNSNRNIVDILLDIMDRGPRPMKNLKAVEKHRNCVDQFWDAHQAEYEARGKLNKDDIKKVNQHHLTYPKLAVELDKRKSLYKVRPNGRMNEWNDSSGRPYDAKCTACVELRRQLQKNTLKPKCRQRKMNNKKNNKTRSTDIQSRVRKTRYRAQKRIKSRLLKTISVNKMSKCCCYVRVKHKSVGSNTSTILNLESKNSNKSDDKPQEGISSKSRIPKGRSKERMISRIDNLLPNEQMDASKSEEERSVENSIKTIKNPDTSIASMSSFNTYESMEQEPMVNMEL